MHCHLLGVYVIKGTVEMKTNSKLVYILGKYFYFCWGTGAYGTLYYGFQVGSLFIGIKRRMK